MPNRRPCPFCGSRETQVGFDEYHVECRGCGAQGPVAKTYDQAEELWNTRRAAKSDGDGKQH